MASLDEDYQLIAVYKRFSDNKFSISENRLSQYLIPKSGVIPTEEQLQNTMKGIAYTKSPSGYIFRKIK